MKKSLTDRISEHKVNKSILVPVFHFFVIALPLAVVWFAGVAFIYIVLADLDRDTTNITNVAAGLCIVLAGLCFSMTRSIYLIPYIKEAVHFSGERFFHSAIFFILASIIKYASIVVLGYNEFSGYEEFLSILRLFFNTLMVPLFLFAFLDAENGLRNINYVLWIQFHERKHLYKSW